MEADLRKLCSESALLVFMLKCVVKSWFYKLDEGYSRTHCCVQQNLYHHKIFEDLVGVYRKENGPTKKLIEKNEPKINKK